MRRDHFSIFVNLIVAIAIGLCLPTGCDEAPPESSAPKMVQKRIIVPPQEILNGPPITAGSQIELPRQTETDAKIADAAPAAVGNAQPIDKSSNSVPEPDKTPPPAATASANAPLAEKSVTAAGQTADTRPVETADLQPSEKQVDSMPGAADSEAQKPIIQPTEPDPPANAQPDEASIQIAAPATDPADRKPDVQGAPAKTAAPDQASADQPTAGSLLAKALAPQQFYDAQGKIDPFAPLIKNEAPEPQAPKKKKIRRAPLTPLEKMALNQLKLVAVIHSTDNDRSIAMVEEASGKGYIVKKGTYIGMNSGRVVNIDTDRIIIREEVENVIGQIKVRETELKLQKAPGEF